MDYYNLQNLLADTQMRDSLAKMGPKKEGTGPVMPTK